MIILKKIGIICEYNPFHNGHIYHLNKIKEMFPNSIIILVMSSCFTERGEISILNKWDKTTLALKYGVDLVAELPFFFSTNSADIFSEGAIKILSYLNVDYLVFGSENNNIELLNNLVDIQLNNEEYNVLVKKYLNDGYNYPTSMSKALYDISNITINSPNDLLGLSYIKQIKLQESKIIPVSIKRTNDYHNSSLDDTIISASNIRELLNNNNAITNYVPKETIECLPKNNDFYNKFFYLLKYKLISEIDNLDKYLDVKEGLDNRIKKFILKCNTYEELINNIKTKRYTYNRLNRMFIHILTNFTNDKVKHLNNITYIRILGFNHLGKLYLKEIKEEGFIPIITNYSQSDEYSLNYELQVSFIYYSLFDNEDNYIKELKSIPIDLK